VRIFSTPPYQNVPELLDSPSDATKFELEESLRDIRLANIFGLGTWVVLHHLKQLVKGVPKERTLRILDLATGSADIPEEICRWARSQGRNVEIVATDISAEIVDVARSRIERAGFGGRVRFVVCDAATAPFSPASFDLVTCSLAFHHLEVRQAERALRQMDRLARVGFVVNDVYRSQGAWLMAWFLTRLPTTSMLTKNDGPISVYRAFTPKELRRMSRNAGVCVSIYMHPFWRVAVVRDGRSTAAEDGELREA